MLYISFAKIFRKIEIIITSFACHCEHPKGAKAVLALSEAKKSHFVKARSLRFARNDILQCLFLGLMLVVLAQPTMAEEMYPDIFQGIVSSTEGVPRYIVVNERKVLLDNKVEVKDHKENWKSLSDLAAGKWIYVVSEKRTPGTTAVRIYLIPNRISGKEKLKYPFMKREEEPGE